MVGKFSVIGCAEDSSFFRKPVICYTLDKGGGLWTHRGLYYSETPLKPMGSPGG